MALKMMIPLVAALAACSPSAALAYDYEDVAHLEIAWDDLLTQPFDEYDVYIYHPACGYCASIKQDILRYALEISRPPLFLLKFHEEIPIDSGAELRVVCELQDVAIRGYPTVILIRNRCVFEVVTGAQSIAVHYDFSLPSVPAAV